MTIYFQSSKTAVTKAERSLEAAVSFSFALSFIARCKALCLSSIVSLMITCALVAGLGFSAVFVGSASAHQQKTAITTVLYNPRTQNLEVSHRFDLHDAEHAVKQIFDTSADIMSSEKTQSDFAKYVLERFALYNLDKTELALSFVGLELEGKHFWVYQETPAPKNLNGLYIQHNALRDIWHQQTNTINVEGMGDIQTLTFTDNTELLSVEFTRH
ncbi:MAG: hypothetical protein ACI9O6_003148 [Glaciecola sp.]|jgi:hypothetical protein